MMWSKKMCTRCLCAATGLVVMISVICIYAVVGSPVPISVTGSQAYIKEISEVKNSLFEVNNRINISGIGIGSVLLVVFLVMMGIATHHIFVKKQTGLSSVRGATREGLPCLKCVLIYLAWKCFSNRIRQMLYKNDKKKPK